jgi:hypothetical protein
MKKFWEILFGIKPAPWAEGGSWRLEWLAMPKHDKLFLLIVVIAFAGFGVLWLYRKEGRNLSLPVRVGLGALRMVVLLGIVAMLLEPVLIISKKEFVPSNLVVLMDRSESMDLKDAYIDQNRANKLVETLKLSNATELRDKSRLGLAQRAFEVGLNEQLGARGDRIVQVRSFASSLMPESSATSQPVTASEKSTTAVGSAIRQALTAYRGQPLAGILVVTDGQSNAGETPMKAAEAAAADGIPVVALATGTPEGPRNAKLSKIEVNPVVFVRDPNQLHVLVESKGLQNAPATLVVEKRKDGGAWEEIAHQPITLEEAGRVQSIPFDFKEDQPAKLEFRAKLEDVGPELTVDDNIGTADVRVIRQKIKVLFVAGSTFPEVEFIRNALLRDNALQASTWLQTADANYIQPGNPVLKRLPNTQEELNDFDCIVLYDPDPALWPPDYAQLLTNFVAQAGGGLVYIAGERETKNMFERPDDPAVSFLAMLPVVSEPGLYRTDVSVKLSSQEPWRLEITPEGRADPIFQFSQKPEENENILSSLPGMYWHYPVTRAKPGATVLARHGDPRMRNEHGPHVLLATQRVGPGRTFWIGYDSTYRWRYLSEQFFDGFWARVIDRAGRAKQLGGRYPYTLATDRASYRPGSNVTLTATFENALERDTGLDVLHGEVEVADQPPIPVTLNPRPGDSNTFETSFSVNHPGLHFIRVWSGGEDMRQIAKAATLQFQVELPNLEYDRPGNDLAALQTIAKASHGSVFELDQLNQVADAFRTKRVARVLEDRQEIWDAPVLFSTILLALFAEWILRKKFRMV